MPRKEIKLCRAWSRQSRAHVDWTARAIAGFGAWSLEQPLVHESLDVSVGRLGMAPPKILPHQVDARLKQIQRRSERVDC